MMLYILIEPKIAGLLLTKLLQAEQEAGLVAIHSFPEPSSLYGTAKGVLSVKREPVAVVRDVQSTYPRAKAWVRQDAGEAIEYRNWPAPLRVFVTVPALERSCSGAPA